jgi:dihydrofolate reductase
MKARLSLLAAMASNRVIGRNNTLPWHLSADLKRFKALTMGQIIVMGRKTYESIGKPLPGRINIIVSRQPDFSVPGAIVTGSIEEALTACAPYQDKEIFIIGGSELYQQTTRALPAALSDRGTESVRGRCLFSRI